MHVCKPCHRECPTHLGRGLLAAWRTARRRSTPAKQVPLPARAAGCCTTTAPAVQAQAGLFRSLGLAGVTDQAVQHSKQAFVASPALQLPLRLLRRLPLLRRLLPPPLLAALALALACGSGRRLQDVCASRQPVRSNDHAQHTAGCAGAKALVADQIGTSRLPATHPGLLPHLLPLPCRRPLPARHPA